METQTQNSSSISIEQVLEVAKWQKRLIWLFLLEVLFVGTAVAIYLAISTKVRYPLAPAPGIWLSLLIFGFALTILNAYFVYKVAHGSGMSSSGAVITLALLVVPSYYPGGLFGLISLAVWLYVIARATRFLRSHGVRVGLMGAKRASLDQLTEGVGPTVEERPGNGTVILRTWLLAMAFAVATTMGTAIFSHVWAAKANMKPANLRNTATHVVVATVVRVYERQETIKDWNYTRYLAELRIKDIENGEGLKKDDLSYARYWRKKWVGAGQPPPDDNGHRGLPKEGETLRIYLARNAYDGYTNENRDGGFNVIGANGFEKLNQTGKH